MNETWLFIDVNFMAWRAYYALGKLTYNEIPTGVLYGFLRDLTTLVDLHNATQLAFAFDRSPGLREAICPTYKESRRKKIIGDPVYRRTHNALCRQVRLLATQILPAIGYQNVYHAAGYEADDVIGSLVCNMLPQDDAIIISADKDLWQCLRGNVLCYNPTTGKPTTLQSFYERWQVEPSQWPDVKAIAGCETDDVVGLEGVGEPTAAKYIRGVLPKHYAAYKKIHCRAGHGVWRENLKLVRLPYAGCPAFVPTPQAPISPKAWAAMCENYGMHSISGLPPIPRAICPSRT